MNNAALARKLEADLVEQPPLRSSAAAHPAAPQLHHRIVPAPPSAAPRGLMRKLWQSLFGPPKIDPQAAPPDSGVFRALYEIGSDYMPNSGTWPAP